MNDYEKKKHEEAYGRGVKDAEKADVVDDLVQEAGEIVSTIVPSSSEHESYKRGWHDQKSGKVEARVADTYESSGSLTPFAESLGCIASILFVIAAVVVVTVALWLTTILPWAYAVIFRTYRATFKPLSKKHVWRDTAVLALYGGIWGGWLLALVAALFTEISFSLPRCWPPPQG